MSTITRLFAPGQVIELRAPNGKKTTAGYFTDYGALEAEAAALSGKAGVYFTLNPINPDLLSRSVNRVKEWAASTANDTDVLCRRWLPLDFDAKRPAGISSSDVEHKAALDRAVQVSEWLSAAGWPSPVIADSGNGAHLLYRIDLPNDAEALKLVKAVLRALADQFDDEPGLSPRTILDQTTANASRIWKMYGTLACKGDSTEDRPHRLAQILEMPDEPGVVTREQLEALVGALTPASESDGWDRVQTAATSLDLEGWLAEHAPEGALSDPKLSPDMEGGDKRTWEIHECPFNADHTDGSAHVEQLSNGALSAGCHHNSCTWGWADLRAKWEPTVAVETVSPAAPFMTRAELREIPPPKWMVEPYIAEGSLIGLIAKFNTGKTFAAINWAMQIAADGRRVLYIVLEGKLDFAQRVDAWEKYNDMRVPNIVFNHLDQSLNLLNQRQVDALCQDIEGYGGFDLVVIDNFGESMPGDENDAADMSLAIHNLQKIRQTAGPRAAILDLHNAGHGENLRARGHSKYHDAHDTMIHMQAIEGSKGGIRVTCGKERIASKFKMRTANLVAVEDTLVYVDQKEADNVLLVAIQGGYKTIPALAAYLDMNDKTVESQLKKMMDKQMVERDGKAGKAIAYKVAWNSPLRDQMGGPTPERNS